MNLQEYQKSAIRTESIIEKLELNPHYINLLFKLFVLNSEILDGIKKEVYYKKSKKADEITLSALEEIKKLATEASRLFGDRFNHTPVELDPRVFHAFLGMATEAGELLQILVKNLESGTPVDKINAQEEMNDSNWYQAIAHEALDLNWEEGLDRNIAKLRARYPEKFTEENATNRDLETERKILEGIK